MFLGVDKNQGKKDQQDNDAKNAAKNKAKYNKDARRRYNKVKNIAKEKKIFAQLMLSHLPFANHFIVSFIGSIVSWHG